MRVTWRPLVLTLALAVSYTTTHAQQSPPQSPAPASAAVERGLEITSDSLIGAKVRNPDGRDIGSVKSLMVDPSQGKINSIAIAIGGLLGIGEKTVLVPWQGVALGREGQRLVLTVRDPVLDQASSASPPNTGSPSGSQAPR